MGRVRASQPSASGDSRLMQSEATARGGVRELGFQVPGLGTSQGKNKIVPRCHWGQTDRWGECDEAARCGK